MRNRYSGLLAIVLTSTICANAQSIDGKVMENDSIPVPYATVSLLQASDSAYVAGFASCSPHDHPFATVGAVPARSDGHGLPTILQDGARTVCHTHTGDRVQSAGAGYRRVAAIAPDRHRWHQSAGKRRAACLYQQQTDAQLE